MVNVRMKFFNILGLYMLRPNFIHIVHALFVQRSTDFSMSPSKAIFAHAICNGPSITSARFL